jgi:hypothetical protein
MQPGDASTNLNTLRAGTQGFETESELFCWWTKAVEGVALRVKIHDFEAKGHASV